MDEVFAALADVTLPPVLAPTMSLVGASTEPIAPAAVCTPSTSAALRPRSCAVCICRPANTTFEFVLLPVMNAPSAPMAKTT